MIRTKHTVFAVAMFCSGQVFSQQPGIIANPEPEPSIGKAPDMKLANRIPDSAQIKYATGNAPHFVNLKAYTINAMSALKHSMAMIEIESSALGVSREDFEELVLILNEYRDLENEDWVNHLALACAPYLRGESMDREYARSALAVLDDSDARKELLADEVMRDIEAVFGQEVVAGLFLRIDEYGKSVDYTKIDLLKLVDESDKLEASSYLVSECAAL